MALNINGRMKVKTLRVDFKKEFGLTLRVYDGRSFADDDSTLAAIRKGDSKGGEFGPRKNTKVGNLEDKIMDMFGIKTQVAGSDDSYLCDNDLTLSGALEADQKKMEKKSKKADKGDKEIVTSYDVAEDGDTPVSMLEKLAGDEDVRCEVACNPDAPVAILEKLAGDEEDNVRGAVAGNPNTPVALLEKLASDEVGWVVRKVAENPNTPVPLLEKLAGDKDKYIRGGVACNPNTPVALLEKLASDEEGWVVRKVPENPNTPVPLLERFAGDEDKYMRRAVAPNPNTPVALLEKLARDDDYDVRSGVARNVNTPVPMLEKLAGDEEWRVRGAVAGNPNTPVAILDKLAVDAREMVSSAATENPNYLLTLAGALEADKEVTNDKSDGDNAEDEEAEEKIYSISGYGREFIIGTLSDDEAERIENDEDIEEVLGEITENDNVIHVYGPDGNDLYITDENGDEVELNGLGIEIDFTNGKAGTKEYWGPIFSGFFDEINDNYEGLNISENFDLTKLCPDIISIYNEGPNENKILVQERVEKGYWGDICLPKHLSNESICLVTLLWEENIPTVLEMLIGYILFDGKNIEFIRLDCDGSTEGKSNNLIIYDIEEEEITWEG